MKDYYAMITPGQAGDWGQVILIDYRIGYFIEKVSSWWDDDNIEEIKKDFLPVTWDFLKEEFNSVNIEDKHFIDNIYNRWEGIMSDNYYQFKKLKSTLHFNSIASLIVYVNEHDLKVIDDFT